MTTITLEETRAAWDRIAAGYDTFVSPMEVPLANEALGRVGLRAGMRFLDVAAGAGGLCLPAARLGARVTAIDLSPKMLERLLARVREQGLDDVQALVMDGHELDLPDASFDVVASQFGVMLFPDLPRALAEMVRVAAPGGRVLMIVYGSPTQIDFLGFFLGAVQNVVPGFPGLPSDPPPFEFQVSDPAVLSDRLREAGLEDVRVEPSVERLVVASGQELWDWVMNSNPIAEMVVGDLDGTQRAGVRSALDAMVRERAGSAERAVLTAPVLIGIGTKD
jgi:ubiquinone/menaquinone biosynthesis C-methylase UbiE